MKPTIDDPGPGAPAGATDAGEISRSVTDAITVGVTVARQLGRLGGESAVLRKQAVAANDLADAVVILTNQVADLQRQVTALAQALSTRAAANGATPAGDGDR